MKKINISYDNLYDVYILKNFSVSGCAKYFNCSDPIIKKFLKLYNIHKSLDKIEESKRNTCIQKYGVDCPSRCKEIRDKQKKTCLDKYGVESPLSNADIKEKISNTIKNKYGCDYPSQNIDIILKRKYVNISRETYEILLDKNRLSDKINEYGKISAENLARKLNCSLSTLNPFLTRYNLRYKLVQNGSAPEDEIREFLRDESITHLKTKRIIPPKEIDIFCPDKNIGIEFNGSYWHSDNDPRMYRDYHLDKTDMCRERGVQLFHIYEYEWKNTETKKSILNMLLCKLKPEFICNIDESEIIIINLDQNTYVDFCVNHDVLLYKSAHGKYYGAYYHKNLIGVFCIYNQIVQHFCVDFKYNMKPIIDAFLSHMAVGDMFFKADISKNIDLNLRDIGAEYIDRTPPVFVWCNSSNIIELDSLKKQDDEMRDSGYWKIYNCGNAIMRYSV